MYVNAALKRNYKYSRRFKRLLFGVRLAGGYTLDTDIVNTFPSVINMRV